ncbi:MAG: hypothetical protein QOK15_2576 [Nocardioidaceae bacterium]|nr:hypothetical protein [Nocardioidaceae bacterium]
MKHRRAAASLSVSVVVPILALSGVPAAHASAGVAVDGVCPPTYSVVPADSELRKRIDAATGSIDGVICAMELNDHAPFPRNLIDNMAR